jgi:hypothetical protein
MTPVPPSPVDKILDIVNDVRRSTSHKQNTFFIIFVESQIVNLKKKAHKRLIPSEHELLIFFHDDML